MKKLAAWLALSTGVTSLFSTVDWRMEQAYKKLHGWKERSLRAGSEHV